MLNPYHGLVNVVEVPGADAVSRDGLDWVLYIQGGCESELMADGRRVDVPLPDVKFGTWNRRDGLRRSPVRYVTDYPQLDAVGGELLERVKAAAGAVPFPQADRYEYWLLHADDNLPLALLDSACDLEEMRDDGPRRWNPGQAAREGFRPEADLLPLGGDDSPAAVLAQRVNAAAGRRPRALWYRRGADGSASPVARSAATLPSTVFPELLLRADWADSRDSALAAAYLQWQAPWLLALQGISRRSRVRLEQSARARALLVDRLHLTYPEVLDATFLKAARVEAALRRSAAGVDGEIEGPAHSFFVSGN